MLNLNTSIETAYLTALTGITYLGNPVPVYKTQLPSTIAPGIYIIYRVLNDGSLNNKTAFVHDITVEVSIYTNSMMYNNGDAVNAVAGSVLNAIYPTTRSNLTLTGGFNMTLTQKDGDRLDDFSVLNQVVYIDRRITFRHRVFEIAS